MCLKTFVYLSRFRASRNNLFTKGFTVPKGTQRIQTGIAGKKHGTTTPTRLGK